MMANTRFYILFVFVIAIVSLSSQTAHSQQSTSQSVSKLSPDEVIATLRKPENSTGNIADAVESVTGGRGWMSADMKPIFEQKVVGQAWTALLRPVLKTDTKAYPNYALQILDEAPAGSILVYVLEDGLEIAGIGNLMATTANVRGIEATIIDGAARDVTEIRKIGHPVFARRISPATSVGRLVSVSKQTPVMCAEVMVHPGDYIVGDNDGVVVVPADAADDVIRLLADYDDKESKMVPIITREKSMLKALEIYGRY
ncbi:MAG: RraA family protein [Saprospiraceae bacterium]|nr:RraA family protein [Saprospiraceae bacterium]